MYAYITYIYIEMYKTNTYKTYTNTNNTFLSSLQEIDPYLWVLQKIKGLDNVLRILKNEICIWKITRIGIPPLACGKN